MIYLNAELIAKALKTVAILGQEKIRENFFFLNRVKRIQRMYKKKMVITLLLTIITHLFKYLLFSLDGL